MRILLLESEGGDVKKWQSFLFGAGYEDIETDGVFGPDTEEATKDFQLKSHLTADGKVGNRTYAAAALLGFPIISTNDAYPPKPDFPYPSEQQRAQMFGTFKFERTGRGNQIKILGDWAKNNLVTVYIPQLAGIENAPESARVTFHKNGAAQLKALFAAWERAGLLKYIRTWAGTFNPRLIRGSQTTLSNHAFGAAFDINAAWNGLGIMPPLEGLDGSVVPLVKIANAHGFFWGGHYNNRKDGMHFEIAVLNRFPNLDDTIGQIEKADNVNLKILDDSKSFPADNREADDTSNRNAGAGYSSPDFEGFGDEIGDFIEDKSGRVPGKVSETVEETKQTAQGQIKKTTEAVTDTFSPLNLPAFIPRFGKQWFYSLVPTGFSLATILAAIDNAPPLLIFFLGFISGIAALGFAQLVIKHREIVGNFIVSCYGATADPQMHNLIPTAAAAFVGQRKAALLSALIIPKPPANTPA